MRENAQQPQEPARGRNSVITPLRTGPGLSPSDPDRAPGPVMLVSLFRTPPDDQTAAFAIKLAASGAGVLILVDSATRATIIRGSALDSSSLADREVRASLQRAAANALTLGLKVERVRIRTNRPTRALIDLIHARMPVAIIFAPPTPKRARAQAQVLDRVTGLSMPRSTADAFAEV
jgi:hypothetical protein